MFTNSSYKSRCTLDELIWKIAATVSVVGALIAMIVAIVALSSVSNGIKSNNNSVAATAKIFVSNGTKSNNNSVAATAKIFENSSLPTSCRDVKGATGVYLIQPEPFGWPINVYCDMDSAGGGWTLVAAVHENDINGKCTGGDKWSSEQKFSKKYLGSQNWENLNVFGGISDVTFDDYKNTAYYAMKVTTYHNILGNVVEYGDLKEIGSSSFDHCRPTYCAYHSSHNVASNVMLWHVPNQVTLQSINESAFLKYYTNNGFLTKYGGTLRSLYSRYAPIIHAGTYRYHKRIVAPVEYIKGSNESIMQNVPWSLNTTVTPGFIQFRAFTVYGYPNALCPGLSVPRGESSRVCVGGAGIGVNTEKGTVSPSTAQRQLCGDFAGWGGKIKDPGSSDAPSSTGRSLKYIKSSILIFTR